MDGADVFWAIAGAIAFYISGTKVLAAGEERNWLKAIIWFFLAMCAVATITKHWH